MYAKEAPGDYATREGDIRLTEGNYEEALASFNRALRERPNHRGALMGRALVFIKTKQYEEATAELTHLINYLRKNLEPDDPTGAGVMAAAYANRGIVHDRRRAATRKRSPITSKRSGPTRERWTGPGSSTR